MPKSTSRPTEHERGNSHRYQENFRREGPVRPRDGRALPACVRGWAGALGSSRGRHGCGRWPATAAVLLRLTQDASRSSGAVIGEVRPPTTNDRPCAGRTISSPDGSGSTARPLTASRSPDRETANQSA
jgi:hypothetical protein